MRRISDGTDRGRNPRRATLLTAFMLTVGTLVGTACSAPPEPPGPLSIGVNEPPEKQAIVRAEIASQQAAALKASPKADPAEPIRTCPTPIADSVTKVDPSLYAAGANLTTTASVTATDGAHYTVFAGGDVDDATKAILIINKDGEEDLCAAAFGAIDTYSKTVRLKALKGPVTVVEIKGDRLVLKDAAGSRSLFDVPKASMQ